MIAAGPWFHVQPIDYELLSVSRDGQAAIGDFRDAHLSEHGPWRIVAGYLALVQRDEDAPVEIVSHGRPVATLERGAPPVLRFAHPVTVEDGLAFSAGAGIAVVATGLRATSPTEVSVEGENWNFTVVHGPAEVKVRNRIALLESLRGVGGRRG